MTVSQYHICRREEYGNIYCRHCNHKHLPKDED